MEELPTAGPSTSTSRTVKMPSFPTSQQAQIIRAHQRDAIQVASLREQAESVLRAWLGNRWLTRWDKEVELAAKLMYYGLTTGRAMQTLGEEYTDIWQHSKRRFPPSRTTRAALVGLATLPGYLIARSPLPRDSHPFLKKLPTILEVIAELNLALFYLRGTYYDLVKRVLGIRYLSVIPENPGARPPSYTLLGILIFIRLLYRLITFLRSSSDDSSLPTSEKAKGKQPQPASSSQAFLDNRPITALVETSADPDASEQPDEEVGTVLDLDSVPPGGRQCMLCLEERTNSAVTECGHLFCWRCIHDWGREKPECPLCRQELHLERLLPIHNL